ncbi:hypothetical protein [Actinocorallia aurantiaca]|uniref:Uncharacterized protein n=1 Tax=Actinocorallia aurantiaca TaxID=46204 RepID=A0ABN3UVA9_9ACTN
MNVNLTIVNQVDAAAGGQGSQVPVQATRKVPPTDRRRGRPVRITVDLDPADYRTMRRLVAELGEATDTPTLAHSAMWRALLHLAADDEQLLARVAEQLRADSSQ